MINPGELHLFIMINPGKLHFFLIKLERKWVVIHSDICKLQQKMIYLSLFSSWTLSLAIEHRRLLATIFIVAGKKDTQGAPYQLNDLGT